MMDPNNPVTRAFLGSHPGDAARLLEQLPTPMVGQLLASLDRDLGGLVLAQMLPAEAAATLDQLSSDQAGAILERMPAAAARRLLAASPPASAEALLATLPVDMAARLRRALTFPVHTVGALMDPAPVLLMAEVTVDTALERIRRHPGSTPCELYVVDRAQVLVGWLGLDRLLKAAGHRRVAELMSREVTPVGPYNRVTVWRGHPAWHYRRSLPVVDEAGQLLGTLDYGVLQAQQAPWQEPAVRAGDDLLAMAEVCWSALDRGLIMALTVGSRGQGSKR